MCVCVEIFVLMGMHLLNILHQKKLLFWNNRRHTHTYIFHIRCIWNIWLLNVTVLINRPNYWSYCVWCETNECRMLLLWIILSVNLFQPQRAKHWSLEANTGQLTDTLMEQLTPPHTDPVMTGQTVDTRPVSSSQIWQIYSSSVILCFYIRQWLSSPQVPQATREIAPATCGRYFIWNRADSQQKRVELPASDFLFRIKAVSCSQVSTGFPGPLDTTWTCGRLLSGVDLIPLAGWVWPWFLWMILTGLSWEC